MRSGTGSESTSRQPGKPSSTNPDRNDSRIRIECGSVSATTRPPRSAAWSDAASCDSWPVGFIDDTPSTFQLSGRWAAADMAASRSRSSSVKPLMQPARIASSVVPGVSRTAAARATSSSARRRPRRHRFAVGVVVGGRRRRGEPHRAGPARLATRARPSRRSASAVAASWQASPITTRRTAEWPTRNPALTPTCAVEALEPVGVARPVPGQPGLERLERHALDPGHHPHEVGGVGLAGRGDGEAAVAAEHGGDAVQRRRAGRRIPGELGVVVGVEVDEAGRHDETGGVDLGGAGLELVGRDDATVAHADVADDPGRAGAVDDETAADQDGRPAEQLLGVLRG